MRRKTKNVVIFVLLFLCTFLPPITSKPFHPQEISLVIGEVITQTSVAYLWLSPLVHVSTLVLLFLLYKYGKKIGRVADLFFGLLFLFFAFGQHIAVIERYGLAIVTGNLVMISVVGLFWIAEAFRPKNEYVFQRLPAWRYWVVPFAFFAFWFPVTDTTPDFNPILLLTSAYGVAFCPTTPVIIALLTLIYPRVNIGLLRVTSFVGLLIGLFNAMSLFTMPGYNLWIFTLHIPLIVISLYGLIIPTLLTEENAEKAHAD